MDKSIIVSLLQNKLERTGSKGNPFLSFLFWKSCIEQFSNNKDLILFEGGDKDILLLSNKSAIIKSSFLPSQAQISLNTFKSIPNEILVNFFRARKSCARLDLLCIDSLYMPIEDIKWKYFEKDLHATTFSISINSSFEEYWNARSKKLRNNIKRYIKRIESDLSGYEFRVVSAKCELDNAIDRYGELESSGWKGSLGTALHPNNQQGAFYKKLLSEFSDTNGAVVYEIYIDGKLVASRLCIQTSQMMIMLKTTFDENMKNYAIGRVLLYEVVKYEFERKVTKSLEFYTNASQDQLSWATEQRDIFHVSLYRNSVVKFLFQSLRSIKNLLRGNRVKDADRKSTNVLID